MITSANLYEEKKAAAAVAPPVAYYKVVNGQLVPVDGALGDPSERAMTALRIDHRPRREDATERVLRVKKAYACLLDMLEAEIPAGSVGKTEMDVMDEAKRQLITSSMWAVRALTA